MEIYVTILLFILVGMLLSGIFYGAGLVIYYNWKNGRATKKHPDFFEFQAEVEKAEIEKIEWELVVDKKKELIDEMAKQRNYLPKEKLKEWDDKMEEIKKEIAVLLDTELRPREVEYLMLKDRLKAWKKKLIEDKEIVEW